MTIRLHHIIDETVLAPVVRMKKSQTRIQPTAKNFSSIAPLCHKKSGRLKKTHRKIKKYRKRYELHAMTRLLNKQVFSSRFNTASGMNCMQYFQKDWKLYAETFQYRKRYGLHAIKLGKPSIGIEESFNTASGMNCMQYCFPEPLETANSKAGFLKLLLFLRFSPNPRELFCRKTGSKELL